MKPAAVHCDNFSRFHIPQELGADCVESAALRGKDHGAVGAPADAQGPEAVGVPDGNQFGGRGNDQRIGSLKAVHCREHRSFDALAVQTLSHDHIGNHFGVRCCVEDAALLLQPTAKLKGVGEIPVVGQSHAALVVIDDQRLHIPDIVRPGGSIADMANCDITLPEGPKLLPAKHLAYKAEVPECRKYTIAVQRDASSFLSPVLQRVKSEIDQRRKISRPGFVETEYAAFFPQMARKTVTDHAHTVGA